jgi:hypothetical protein
MSRVAVTCAALVLGSVLCLEAAIARAQDGPYIPGLDSAAPIENQSTATEPAGGAIAPREPAYRPQRSLLPARPPVRAESPHDDPTRNETRSPRPDPFEEPSSNRTTRSPGQSFGLTRPAVSTSAQGAPSNRPTDPRLRQWQQQQQQMQLQQQLQQRANQQRQQGDPRYGRPQQNVPTTRTGNPSTSRQAPQSIQRPPTDPRRYTAPNSSAKKKTSFFGR